MKYSSKNYKGGVRINEEFLLPSGIKPTRNEAIETFIYNSTFSVLTNDSISCITIVATLNPNVITPFKSMRSDNLKIDIRRLLMKIFITHETQDFQQINGRGRYNGIEITSHENFKDEIKRQRDIYKESFKSLTGMFDAICPAIIFSHESVYDKGIQKLRTLEGMKIKEQKELNEILDAAAIPNSDRTISIIYMEMMEGFMTASNYFDNLCFFDKYSIFKTQDTTITVPKLPDNILHILYFIQYEFFRLANFGYLHGDAHFSNIMINPNYNYFSNKLTGRAIIIDFGRTQKIESNEKYTLDNGIGTVTNTVTKTSYQYEDSYIEYIRENYPVMIAQHPDILINFSVYKELENLRKIYTESIIVNNIKNVFNWGHGLKAGEFIAKLLEVTANDAFVYQNPVGGKMLLQMENDNNNPMLLDNTKNNLKTINIPDNKNNELNSFSKNLESEIIKQRNMDPSYLFSLLPISNQIKNMSLDEFKTIVRDQYFNNEIEEPVNTETGGKKRKSKLRIKSSKKSVRKSVKKSAKKSVKKSAK